LTPTAPGGAHLIYSGQWQTLPEAHGYYAAMLGDILAERLVWGPQAPAIQLGKLTVAGPGYIWFRFWLLRDLQVVEKYFDALGQALGMQIDVCTPLGALPDKLRVGPFANGAKPFDGCSTTDLLLAIWIAADGQVTVRNEAAFERAASDGALTPEEVHWAEERVRKLTSAVAQGRFPPALIRNWQLDVQKVQESLAAS
jgi:hypothetical protein